MFAAIDIETTGLDPRSHRIIEIGVVLFDESGLLDSEFQTLVNPERVVTNSRIHGLQTTDLHSAPRFAEVLPELAEILAGRVLVAHNSVFDLRFVGAEIERAGLDLDDLSALCTLNLMRKVTPQGPRRLVECCDYFGLPREPAHRALGDARMTARLGHHLIRSVPSAAELGVPVFSGPRAAARLAPPSEPPATPRIVEPQDTSFLRHLLARLPDDGNNEWPDDSHVLEYVNILDRALEDRLLSTEEAFALYEFADDFGLSRGLVRTIHGTYFSDLCRAAAMDMHVSYEERSDLQSVAALLSISDWEDALKGAIDASGASVEVRRVWKGGIPSYATGGETDIKDSDFVRAEESTDFSDPAVTTRLSGVSLVVTGEFRDFSRAQAKDAITKRGGKAATSLSSKTRALVAGDSAGPSKLEKATQLGTPVLDVSQFRYLLDTGTLPS